MDGLRAAARRAGTVRGQPRRRGWPSAGAALRAPGDSGAQRRALSARTRTHTPPPLLAGRGAPRGRALCNPRDYSVTNSFNVSTAGAPRLFHSARQDLQINFHFTFFFTHYLSAGCWRGAAEVAARSGAPPPQRNSPPSVPLLKGALRCGRSARYVALKRYKAASGCSASARGFAAVTGKIKVKDYRQ